MSGAMLAAWYNGTMAENEKQPPTADDPLESFTEGLAHLHSILSRIAPAFEVAANAFASKMEEAKQIAQFVTGKAVEGLAKQFEDWEEKREEHNKKHEKLMFWLLDFGWPPLLHAPYTTTQNLFDHVNGLPHDEAQNAIDDAVLYMHDERIFRNMLQGWERRKILANRMPILRSVVAAHQRGDYALSVPAMLPQIEGFIADCFGHSGHFGNRHYTRYIESITKQGFFGMEVAYRRFILEHLLGVFKHGTANFFFINRHKILHGAATDYATAPISLRAILLFDFIESQIQYAAVETDTVYHYLSCEKLQKTPGKRTIYFISTDAELDGKTPCADCKPNVKRE